MQTRVFSKQCIVHTMFDKFSVRDSKILAQMRCLCCHFYWKYIVIIHSNN